MIWRTIYAATFMLGIWVFVASVLHARDSLRLANLAAWFLMLVVVSVDVLQRNPKDPS